MRLILRKAQCLIIFIFTSSFVLWSAAVKADEPIGTWQLTVNGLASGNIPIKLVHTKGIAFMTFTESMTIIGYGIIFSADGSLDRFVFDINGTWTIDSKGVISGNLGPSFYGVNFSLTGKARKDKSLLMKIVETTGSGFVYSLSGVPSKSSLDISGDYLGKLISNGGIFAETYTLVVDSDHPKIFNLTGSGEDRKQTYILEGIIVVGLNSRIYAYLTAFPDSQLCCIELNSFGEISKSGKVLTLRGRSSSGYTFTESATRH